MNNDRLTYKTLDTIYKISQLTIVENWKKILDDLNMQESLLSGQTIDLKVAEDKNNIITALEWQDSLD